MWDDEGSTMMKEFIVLMKQFQVIGFKQKQIKQKEIKKE